MMSLRLGRRPSTRTRVAVACLVVVVATFGLLGAMHVGVAELPVSWTLLPAPFTEGHGPAVEFAPPATLGRRAPGPSRAPPLSPLAA